MKRRCAAPITSSISARAQGCTAAKSWRKGRCATSREHASSETGRCLSTPLCHPARKARRSLGEVEHWIEIRGAQAHNLKNVDARFPVGRLSVITGISGSGKSTLMRSVLLPAVQKLWDGRGRAIARASRDTARRSSMAKAPLPAGERRVSQIFGVDAIEASTKSISRRSAKRRARRLRPTSRSSTKSASLYAQLPVSRVRGYTREPLFLQRRRRPLRNLQWPGRDQAGDELSAEQLCAV